MQRAICNKLVQRALRDAQAALQAGNQSALRLAIGAAHLCVEENFLHEMQEDMRAEHTLEVLPECLPDAGSPRQRRLEQAVAMLNQCGVSA
jgi:hypothetical protein